MITDRACMQINVFRIKNPSSNQCQENQLFTFPPFLINQTTQLLKSQKNRKRKEQTSKLKRSHDPHLSTSESETLANKRNCQRAAASFLAETLTAP